MIFLCGGGGQPACPAATSGAILGTITAANVTGPALQGIAAGDLTSALEAVREGNAYANMPSQMFPLAEIPRPSPPREPRREGGAGKVTPWGGLGGRRSPRPAIAENRESDPSLERREAS